MGHTQKHSEESKKKMSKSLKGRKVWNKGKHISEEHKRKIGLSNEGHVAWNKGLPKEQQPAFGIHTIPSKAAKENMSKARIDGIKSGRIKNWNKGKTLSNEHKEKISKNHRRYQTQETIEKIKNNAKINPKFGFTGHKHSEKTIGIIKEERKKQVLPRQDTSIEIKIQQLLQQLGIEFYTHKYTKNIEHDYQCDITIPMQEGIFNKTIIECFGTYWHNYPTGREIDTLRCNELRKAGWKVLVFWENEIKVMELNDFKEIISNEK